MTIAFSTINPAKELEEQAAKSIMISITKQGSASNNFFIKYSYGFILNDTTNQIYMW